MPGSGCRLLSPYLRGSITSHQRTEDLQELNERARAKALHSKSQQETWASKAAAGVSTGTNIDVHQPMTRPTPPQHQGKEDVRIMIRLNREHEARKADPLLLRQQVQRLILDPSLVVDARQVPSSVAVPAA
ncbi:unnamed protein product [Blumeria hordei]|uniref:Uncharacterized protein n=1 Tax=Blumeria hordei TaxID=2867405 RepID=A0A383UGE9_BLUHO|nr:unnamed protein product [Blumeria hordei]